MLCRPAPQCPYLISTTPGPRKTTTAVCERCAVAMWPIITDAKECAQGKTAEGAAAATAAAAAQPSQQQKQLQQQKQQQQ